MHLDARLIRPTFGSVAYVVGVGLLVGVGLAVKSPAPVLPAVVVSLPVGFAALVAYYLAYGLLAQLPGATSATSTGSGVVNPDGSGSRRARVTRPSGLWLPRPSSPCCCSSVQPATTS